MADKHTKKMLREYVEQAPAPNFLTGFFQSPKENYHTTESVEFDIERDGEDVAVVVRDLSSKGRKNESTLYTNKEFVPPVYKEEATVAASKLIERSMGDTPYAEPVYHQNAVKRALGVFRKLEKKIARAIEVQASQVLQTGELDLKDASGNTLYSLDFEAKPTHFPGATAAWDASSGVDIIGDLEALADVILTDGKIEAHRLILGRKALLAFLANEKVQKLLDNRRMDLGAVGRPEVRGAGGKYHGHISAGQFTFEIWSYAAGYIDPQTGNFTRYVDDASAIMLGDGRLDLTFGGVPRIGSPDSRALPFLPPRMSNGGRNFDVHPNAWIEPDGESLTLAVSARPMCIPTVIDSFGCIDTQVS